jgi:diacylglycerol kinase (ATP)
VKAFVLHNPLARNMKRDWPVIAAALKTVFPRYTGMATPGRGHAARLVRDALREGHGDIVVVGGDGTINEAVNGFFEHGAAIAPDAVLNIVCSSDGDIAAGHQTGVAAALALAHQDARPHDIGHVACVTPDGRAASRFFLNAASLGITGDMARRRNRARILPLLGDDVARMVSEAAALAAWRSAPVRLMADNSQDEIAGIAAIGILNGPQFAGMKISGKANPADGMFDIAILGGGKRGSIRRAITRLRAGEEAPLRLWRSTRLTVAPTLDTRAPVFVETDGEAMGVLPATFEILPGAIRVRL